jgi:site-specific DNA-methyltransferase (adenine-specific)
MNRVHFSSENREWETPNEVFKPLQKKYNIVLDTCATLENKKTVIYLDKKINGLKADWFTIAGNLGGSCWMNPPYGRGIELWVKKAHDEALKGMTTVALLPARTDTNWFHTYIYTGNYKVTFLKGRIRFVDAESSAPFPSMIVVFEPKTKSKETKWKKLKSLKKFLGL